MKTKLLMLALIILVACKKKETTPEPVQPATTGSTPADTRTVTIKAVPQYSYTELSVDWDYSDNGSQSIFADSTHKVLGTVQTTKVITVDSIAFIARSRTSLPSGSSGWCDVEVKVNGVVTQTYSQDLFNPHYIKIK